MDGFFLFSSVSRRDSSFHPGWGPGVSAGTALCLPLYLHTCTLTHTDTYTHMYGYLYEDLLPSLAPYANLNKSVRYPNFNIALNLILTLKNESKPSNISLKRGEKVSSLFRFALTHTHTRSHTHTQMSNLPEPCFSEAPATAHEICLYHLVAVKVLVWTTMSASDSQSVKMKKKEKWERKREDMFAFCEENFSYVSIFIFICPKVLVFRSLFFLSSPLTLLLLLLLFSVLKPAAQHH